MTGENSPVGDDAYAGELSEFLETLTAYVVRVNAENGWRSRERTFGESVALIHSEVSEALEAYRDGGEDTLWEEFREVPLNDPLSRLSVRAKTRVEAAMDRALSGEDVAATELALTKEELFTLARDGVVKPEGVGSEFADVLIRLLDEADRWGVDLGWEVARKLAYNQTRGYRHGNKRL